MDIGTRIKICQLLDYVQNNPSFSKRIGIKNVSYYEENREHGKVYLDTTQTFCKRNHNV